MSWFKRALTITTVHGDSYYTVVDPGEFYEWKFANIIPKGKVFTKRLPPSDAFTDGMIIATARLPDSVLEKNNFGFKTNQDVDTEIFLQAGQIQSPIELLNRYHRIKENFKFSIEQFKKSCQVRPYFSSYDKNFYRIVSGDSNGVKILNYGPVKVLMDKLSSVRKLLSKESIIKKGRAHELEYFRRFENAMTFMENGNIPLDAGKIDTLLNIAQIHPEQSHKLDWESCFIKVSSDAGGNKALLDRYKALSWVRAGTSDFNS